MKKKANSVVDETQERESAFKAVVSEHNIDTETLINAIKDSILNAIQKNYGSIEHVKIDLAPGMAKLNVYYDKVVVEQVDPEDPTGQISLAEAKMKDPTVRIGDHVHIPIDTKGFGRIATQNAKSKMLQNIREAERRSQYAKWYQLEKDIVKGTVQRQVRGDYYVDLGHMDAVLKENEQVPGEEFQPYDSITLYVLEVKDTNRGPRITVSRSHPELVKRLFEKESPEVHDGIVEIRAIAREAGSRTKIAVSSCDENVDPVGACVGPNGSRVNAVVDELCGEKIDIINWDENIALLIENALSPAKVILVAADEEAKEAQVIVPDYQLSLAIGKEGQNARLAAKLTGYRIDIKSETQARESGLLDELEQGYEEGFEGYTDDEIIGEAVEDSEIDGQAEEEIPADEN
ncbi:transcription termination factor NusA [[Clostridium] aminophilum]|uniref:transcription termination factor NusA n=1 Tax=[Clostridium] aminophilum TaxID=1526 RepID=UPI00332A6DB9